MTTAAARVQGFQFHFCAQLVSTSEKKIQYTCDLQTSAEVGVWQRNNWQSTGGMDERQMISIITGQRWNENPDQRQWKAVGCAYQTFPLKAGGSSGCLAVKHRVWPELSTALRESLAVWSVGGLSTLLCLCLSLSYPLFSPWPCFLQHLLTAPLSPAHFLSMHSFSTFSLICKRH